MRLKSGVRLRKGHSPSCAQALCSLPCRSWYIWGTFGDCLFGIDSRIFIMCSGGDKAFQSGFMQMRISWEEEREDTNFLVGLGPMGGTCPGS